MYIVCMYAAGYGEDVYNYLPTYLTSVLMHYVLHYIRTLPCVGNTRSVCITRVLES